MTRAEVISSDNRPTRRLHVHNVLTVEFEVFVDQKSDDVVSVYLIAFSYQHYKIQALRFVLQTEIVRLLLNLQDHKLIGGVRHLLRARPNTRRIPLEPPFRFAQTHSVPGSRRLKIDI